MAASGFDEPRDREPAVVTLLRLLHDEKPPVRASAARAIGAIGTRAGPPALAGLLETLDDPAWSVRLAAVQALSDRDEVDRDRILRAFAGLVEEARNPDDLRALVDAFRESTLGPMSVPALARALGDDERAARVIDRLRRVDPISAGAAPVMGGGQ